VGLFAFLHKDVRGARLRGASILKELIFNPGYRVVVYYRLSEYLICRKKFQKICKFFGYLLRVRISRVPGVEINTIHEIGSGLKLFHPHDIVIGYGTKIGRNVTIYNGVSLGGKKVRSNGGEYVSYPIVENNVTIYPGAKVIGGCTLGKGASIAANSVVLSDIPPNSLAVGIPAKVIKTLK